MDNKELNSVQIIIRVGQLLSERKMDELGQWARQDERVFQQLVETVRGGNGLFCFTAAASLIQVDVLISEESMGGSKLMASICVPSPLISGIWFMILLKSMGFRDPFTGSFNIPMVPPV